MGRGDRKTRKGKIYRGSHGNVRPHSPKSKAAVKKTTSPVKTAARPAARPTTRPATRPAVKKAPAKRAPAKKST